MNSLKIIILFRSNAVVYCFRSVFLSPLFVIIMLGYSHTTIASIAPCDQYTEYFIEASQKYGIPQNLLIGIALEESGCNQRAENKTDEGCGIMQLTEKGSNTRSSLAASLGVNEDELCENSEQGARLNILGGALRLSQVKCYASPRVITGNDLNNCIQGKKPYALTDEEIYILSNSLEVWWWPVTQYNGGGADGMLTTSNYPYRVWSHINQDIFKNPSFLTTDPRISYPPLDHIKYVHENDRMTEGRPFFVKYDPHEVDDALYPTPDDLGDSGDKGGIRWTSGLSENYNPFKYVVLHNNEGYADSKKSQGSVNVLPDNFSIIPPVKLDDWSGSAQDYAEFNTKLTNRYTNKYHTGIDISASEGSDVYAVADGKIVLFQFNAPNDFGWGNTIVVRHGNLTNPIYSQYSHLKEITIKNDCLKTIKEENKKIIENCKTSPNTPESCKIKDEFFCLVKENCAKNEKYACINTIDVIQKQKIGTVGGTGSGKDPKWPIHLHFELKEFSSIEKYKGYTKNHPSYLKPEDYGENYLDPALYIEPKPRDLGSEVDVFVTKAGNDAILRGGPSKKYVPINKTKANEKFKVFRKGDSTERCALGWYQVRNNNKEKFLYSSDTKTTIDEAWICIGQKKGEEWILPSQLNSTSNIDIKFATALILDRSGSMQYTLTNPDGTKSQKLESAKQAAKAFILTLNDTNGIAVSTFSDAGNTELPFSLAPNVRQTIDQALAKINAGGGTNIGAGLDMGFLELQKASAGSMQTALLLSDGQNNLGDLWAAVDKYITNDWPICTIGFGLDADETTLRKIAYDTGCAYAAAEAFDIVTRYQELAAYAKGASSPLSARDLLMIKGKLIYEFVVSRGTKSLTANTTWPGSMLKTVLITPDGTRIEDTNISSEQGRYVEGKTFQLLEIKNPAPGKWRVELSWKEAPPSPEQVNILVTEKTDVFVRIHGLKSQYSMGQTVDVNTDAFEVVNNRKIPLKNATVKIEVKKPGDEVIRLIQAQSTSWTMYKDVLADIRRDVSMFDDGAHSDYHPQDGIFGGSFTETDKNGVYLVTATITGQKQNGEAIEKTIINTFQVGSIMNNPVSTSQTLHYIQQAEENFDNSTPVSTDLLNQPVEEINQLQQGSDPLDEINQLLQ